MVLSSHKRTDSPAESSSFAITIFTVGTVLLVYGINGIKVTSFTSSFGGFSSTPMTIKDNELGAKDLKPPSFGDTIKVSDK
jgi:hypothetical protein